MADSAVMIPSRNHAEPQPLSTRDCVRLALWEVLVVHLHGNKTRLQIRLREIGRNETEIRSEMEYSLQSATVLRQLRRHMVLAHER